MHYIGFDAETHLITDHDLAPQPVCWSFSGTGAHKGNKVIAHCEHAKENWRAFWMTLLRKDDITLVAHNLPFDALLLHVHYGVPINVITDAIEAGTLRDTMIREKLIAIALGSSVTEYDVRTGYRVRYGLDALVKTYLKEDISESKSDPDSWRLRYSELDGIPASQYPKPALRYSLLDSVYALKVFARQIADNSATPFGRLQDPERPTLIRDEIPQTRCQWNLHCAAALAGPYIDQTEAEAFTTYHKAEADKGQQGVVDLGLVVWNKNKYPKLGPPKSPERGGWSKKEALIRNAVEADYVDNNVPQSLWEYTDSGKISIKGDVLRACFDPALRAYGDSMGSLKMLDSFVKPLQKAGNGRLTSSPNAIVNTGRTSWAKPNMQQPPKKGGWRECFVPAPGKVYGAIDYSAIEMAGLAQVLAEKFGNKLMLSAINDGMDLHIVFGSKIVNMSYNEALAIYYDQSDPLHSLVATARQAAKPFNFGRAGGMGAATFLSTLDEDVKVALQTIDPNEDLVTIVSNLLKLWDDTWDAHAYFRDVGKRVRLNDGAFWYRHPISGRIRGRIGYCDGCNIQFQGRVADGFKLAIAKLQRWIHDGAPCAMWNAIHDEVLFEGEEESATEWAHEASRIMCDGMQQFVPDVKVEADPALMRRWMKGAEGYYENGILIPHDRLLLNTDIASIPQNSNYSISHNKIHDCVEVRGPETLLQPLIEEHALAA